MSIRQGKFAAKQNTRSWMQYIRTTFRWGHYKRLFDFPAIEAMNHITAGSGLKYCGQYWISFEPFRLHWHPR